METTKSLEIIENMLNESRKSLHQNSFYFILWGILMAAAGVIESVFIQTPNVWMVWPLAGILGGIISFFYGRKEAKQIAVHTALDRVTNYTWSAFAFTLVFAIIFSLYNQLSPNALVLMIAGSATFISGGISKFKPLLYGALFLGLGAMACAFLVPANLQGYVFAISLILGYVIPGFILRKAENGQA